MRNALRALIAADLLRKMLHRYRPYEAVRGATDACYQRAIGRVEQVIERPGLGTRVRMDAIAAALAGGAGRVPPAARAVHPPAPARSASSARSLPADAVHQRLR